MNLLTILTSSFQLRVSPTAVPNLIISNQAWAKENNLSLNCAKSNEIILERAGFAERQLDCRVRFKFGPLDKNSWLRPYISCNTNANATTNPDANPKPNTNTNPNPNPKTNPNPNHINEYNIHN